MFIVELKFSNNKNEAKEHMAGHMEWIKQGFADDVFLMAGSIQPNLGGAVMAHNTSLSELDARVNQDPFVVHDIVTAEIIEITPSKTDDRLNFLL
ncbi:MAG: YciI family protein [Rhizobiaceae bacterium]